MTPLIAFIDNLISWYELIVFAAVILSWLVAYRVVSPYNEVVRQLSRVLGALTEPLLQPIRKFVPYVGGLDFSPLILLLGCQFLRQVVIEPWLGPAGLR